MRSEINSISITIDSREALAIFNALNRGLSIKELNEDDNLLAVKFKEILQSNFFSSVTGVHTPKRR